MSLASIHAAHGETPRHTVQFYDREDFLYARVAGFLAAGVMSGDSALVVATDEHRRGITGALSARGVDASAIVFADAQATLHAFMRGDHPNGPLFRAAIRSLLGETGRPVRAYGEMVDLLCRANQAGAAVELEELWNDLCRDEPITLLCAYPLADFQRGTDACAFDDICAAHASVLPAGGMGDQEDDPRRRELARLQQRAAALEAEMEARAFLLDAVTIVHRSLDAEARMRELASLIVPRIADGCTITTGVEPAHLGAISDTPFTVAMQINDHILGTLALHGMRCHESLAAELARHAAIALENSRLYTIARNANRTKDEFLATLSHELRTPLTAILGWSRMLEEGLDETMTRTALEVITRSASTQSALIDDLLDVSSIVSGKLVMKCEAFDVRSAVASAAQTLQLAADARGVSIDVSLGDEPAIITGDPTRIQQVVWNLVGNAVKFSGSGCSIRVAVTRGADAVLIEVRDQGCGIAADFLPHVFESFRQADSGTSRAYNGLGLGLAIVKYVTELHGGSVRAESDGRDRGAAFTVTLPLRISE